MTQQQSNQASAITYTLVRKQVKNINLRVRADGSVTVSANPQVTEERIAEFVQSKAQFILEAQAKFQSIEDNSPQPKQYISGESVRILGRDLRLKVEQGQRESIQNDGVYLTITVQDVSDFKKKERLVQRYLSQRCREEFMEQAVAIHQKFAKYGVAIPQVRMREMKTRWGSCLSTKGIITLNTKLLEMPRNCIEYVVLHEFCHFIHPNHSRAFYDFLAMFMPDWKERKQELERHGRGV